MHYVCETIPLAVRPTLLRQMNMASFTFVHTSGVCRTHEGGSGTSKSALGVDSQGQKSKSTLHRTFHYDLKDKDLLDL